MKATGYFQEQVLRKRPSLEPAWFAAITAAPLRRSVQPDGRVRFWGKMTNPRDGQSRILRVITLEDGETLHNAFFDRAYREDAP